LNFLRTLRSKKGLKIIYSLKHNINHTKYWEKCNLKLRNVEFIINARQDTIFIQVLDRKSRASIFCKQLNEKYGIKERCGNGLICVVQLLSFLWDRGSHKVYFQQCKPPSELEYFTMSNTTNWKKKGCIVLQKSDFCLNFGSHRNFIHLAVKNKTITPVRTNAVLALFHKQNISLIVSV